jgi:threonine/homoserine/homoserine lactone efflux protein
MDDVTDDVTGDVTGDVSGDVSSEIDLAGHEIAVAGDDALVEELAAERSLWHAIIVGMLIAVPICILIWCGIIALAVGPNDPQDWFAWLGIGAVVGVLAGAFFGAWAGFTAKAHLLDDVDHRAARH